MTAPSMRNRSGFLVLILLFLTSGSLIWSAPAHAAAPRVVVGSVGEIQAAGAGIVMHETVTCQPEQYVDASLSVYQGHGSALAQRTGSPMRVTCDGHPHGIDVLVSTPIYDFIGSEDEGGYFAERPSVAFTPGPAALIVGFGYGHKQITLTTRRHDKPSSNMPLPATVVARGHGVALPVTIHTTCTGEGTHWLAIAAAQKNTPLLEYGHVSSQPYNCSGQSLDIKLLVPASDRLWHSGAVELSVGWCEQSEGTCSTSWRTAIVH